MDNIFRVKTVDVNKLVRGDVVIAVRHLDKPGANVNIGVTGVVFETTNHYGDENGPMVRWMNMGACNVYNGDVMILKEDHDENDAASGN